jgi:hypothetical protein
MIAKAVPGRPLTGGWRSAIIQARLRGKIRAPGSFANMLRIIEWKRTTTQYVALLQVSDRFEPNSIKEIERHGPETVLGGTLRGTMLTDWYALAYDRREVEFDEARDMARSSLERYREQQQRV